MKMCNIMMYLSYGNNGRTTNEAFHANIFCWRNSFCVLQIVYMHRHLYNTKTGAKKQNSTQTSMNVYLVGHVVNS